MLNVTLQPNYGIAIFEMDGQLSSSDFDHAAHKIDPYLEQVSGFKGGVVCVANWPLWDSSNAFFAHLQFIHAHHRYFEKVAVVSNSLSFKLFAPVYGASIYSQVKCFSIDGLEQSKRWILADDNFEN